MIDEPVPAIKSLRALRAAEAECRRCPLYRNAIQAVPGEGPAHARMMMVGEQPGDQEDKQGHPFVGPAGAILARALVDAGIDRGKVFVTNAVKHFKFEPRGKRRIHKKPNSMEILACQPWLEAEMKAVRPELIVALGVTAAQSLLHKKVAITPLRGRFLEHPWAKSLFVTIHPSAILRAQTDEDREREYANFVHDLRAVAGWLRRSAA